MSDDFVDDDVMTNTSDAFVSTADSWIIPRSWGHICDVAIMRTSDGWSVAGLFSAVGQIMTGEVPPVEGADEARALLAAIREACDFAESRIR